MQGGGVFVEDEVTVHDGRNITLGVDGVEINSGCGLVVGEVDLLAVHLHTSDVGADEAGGTAGGSGVVKLGHRDYASRLETKNDLKSDCSGV